MKRNIKLEQILDKLNIPYFVWECKDLHPKEDNCFEYIVSYNLRNNDDNFALSRVEEAYKNGGSDYTFSYILDSDLYVDIANKFDKYFTYSFKDQNYWVLDGIDIFSSKHLPILAEMCGKEYIPIEYINSVIDYLHELLF